jgi:hypothetical protein
MMPDNIWFLTTIFFATFSVSLVVLFWWKKRMTDKKRQPNSQENNRRDKYPIRPREGSLEQHSCDQENAPSDSCCPLDHPHVRILARMVGGVNPNRGEPSLEGACQPILLAPPFSLQGERDKRMRGHKTISESRRSCKELI